MDEVARLIIRVDDRDAPRVVKNLGDVTKGMQRAEDGAAKMAASVKSMLGGLAAALSVRELVTYSDAATNLANRLRLVTESEADRVKTSRELFDISRRTRSEITATSELYVKLRQSNENLNYTTAQTRDLTEAFALSLKASGADAATSAGAIRQFAQAMAAGAVRGDEFVTISEAAPVVLQLMQKELGKSRAELLKMKEEGQLTAGVIGGVLLKNLDALRTQAAGSTLTIADGFTALRNSVIKTVGASNDLAAATKNIAEGLAGAGKWLEDNGPLLGGVVKATALFWGMSRAVTAGAVAFRAIAGAMELGGIAKLITVAGGPFGLALRGAALAMGGLELASAAKGQEREAYTERQRDVFGKMTPEMLAQTGREYDARIAAAEKAIRTMRDEAGKLLTGSAVQRIQQDLGTLQANRALIAEAGFGTRGSAIRVTEDRGGSPTPPVVPPSTGETAAQKAKKELDAMLKELSDAGKALVAGIERRFEEMGALLDALANTTVRIETGQRQIGIGRETLRRTPIIGADAPGPVGGMVYRDRGIDPEKALTETIEQANAVTNALASGLQRSIADGISGGFRDGSKSLEAFANNLKRTLINVFSEALANDVVGGLMGKSSGGGIGALLGGLLGKGGASKVAGAAGSSAGGLGGLGALGGLGIAALGFAGVASLLKPNTERARDKWQTGPLSSREFATMTPESPVIAGGTYNAPAGFNAAAYRFEAGRPTAPTVTGNTIVVTLPEGTPREQAEAMLREFERLARAQGLPAGTLPLSRG